MPSWRDSTASLAQPSARLAVTAPPPISSPCSISLPENSAFPNSNSTENSEEPYLYRNCSHWEVISTTLLVPAQWAQREFALAELGDQRRTERLVSIATRL